MSMPRFKTFMFSMGYASVAESRDLLCKVFRLLPEDARVSVKELGLFSLIISKSYVNSAELGGSASKFDNAHGLSPIVGLRPMAA